MHTDFERDGILRVAGAVAPDTVRDLREHFWQAVERRFAIREDAPDTWLADATPLGGDARGRRLSGMNPVMQGLREAGALEASQRALQGAVDRALGPTRWQPKGLWYSLLSFPTGTQRWAVPRRSWHADEPAVAGDALPWTVFVFVFLRAVPHRGGGTVVVTGSHRCAEHMARREGRVDSALVRVFADDNEGLVDPDEARVISPVDVMGRLSQESPWFRELGGHEGEREREGDGDGDGDGERVGRYMRTGGVHEGVPVRVVELTGAPGDVVVMDPRCVHSVSANVAGVPRQVLRLDFRRVPA